MISGNLMSASYLNLQQTEENRHHNDGINIMKLKSVLIYSTILAIATFLVTARVLDKATYNTGPRVNESVKDVETVAIAYPVLLA